MPYELQVIRAAEFIRVGSHGRLDFESSKRALETLARACRTRGIDQAVLDLRALPIPTKPVFSVSQLASLVETFREVGFGARQRLAVLYRSDPHEGARMFAFISRMRGWQVRAFQDFEQALLWLSDQQYEQPTPDNRGVSIKSRLSPSSR